MKYKFFNYKTFSWKKYVFETLSIFIAVVSAFALNNWNLNRRDRVAEKEILIEVKNGIENDLLTKANDAYTSKDFSKAAVGFENLYNVIKKILHTCIMLL